MPPVAIDPGSPDWTEQQRYAIDPDAVLMLQSAIALPTPERARLLAGWARDHGTAPLVLLFAQFMGLANRVDAVNLHLARQLVERSGGSQVGDPNMASVRGGLAGALLAGYPDPKETRCETCAFRAGTPANLSGTTTLHAMASVLGVDAQFDCHKRDGACAGYAQAVRE